MVLGITLTDVGPLPFSFDCPVPEGTPDGPVDVGAENPQLKETLDHAKQMVGKQLSKKRLRVEVEHLVLRARNGDQNAMAMLIGIKDAAQKGHPVARRSLAAVHHFIENHPVDETEFSGESEKETAVTLSRHIDIASNPDQYCIAVFTLLPYVDQDKAVTIIADGPLVDKRLTEIVLEALESDEDKEQFQKGFSGTISPMSEAGKLGKVFRKARQLQAGRHGRFDLFCPMVAWELGV